MTDETSLAQRLRLAGLRVTAPRLAVLHAVQQEGRHPDVTEITAAARQRLGTLSTQSVYDNLNVLVEAGLVRCIQLPGHPARYEGRVGDNHHHIVCRRCGAAHDIDCAIGTAPCLEPSADHGYILEEAEVIFWGICPHCQLLLHTERPEESQP